MMMMQPTFPRRQGTRWLWRFSKSSPGDRAQDDDDDAANLYQQTEHKMVMVMYLTFPWDKEQDDYGDAVNDMMILTVSVVIKLTDKHELEPIKLADDDCKHVVRKFKTSDSHCHKLLTSFSRYAQRRITHARIEFNCTTSLSESCTSTLRMVVIMWL